MATTFETATKAAWESAKYLAQQAKTEQQALIALDVLDGASKAMTIVCGIVDGFPLSAIPEELRTYDVCEYAIRRDGLCLKSVPQNLIDRNLCLKAVAVHGHALQWVPMEFRDTEICQEAAKRGYATPYVPTNLLPYISFHFTKHHITHPSA